MGPLRVLKDLWGLSNILATRRIAWAVINHAEKPQPRFLLQIHHVCNGQVDYDGLDGAVQFSLPIQ